MQSCMLALGVQSWAKRGRWFPKKGFWGSEDHHQLKQPIINPMASPLAILQGSLVTVAASRTVPSEEQRGLQGKHAPIGPGLLNSQLCLSFTDGCPWRQEQVRRVCGGWTPGCLSPILTSRVTPEPHLRLTLRRITGSGLKGGSGISQPGSILQIGKLRPRAKQGVVKGHAESVAEPGQPPAPAPPVSAHWSDTSRGAASGPSDEREQQLQRDGGGPAQGVLGARVLGALGQPRRRGRVPSTGLRWGGGSHPAPPADPRAAAPAGGREHKRCR